MLVKVLRAFYLDNVVIEKDRKIDLPEKFAKEMVHCKKVVAISENGTPAPTPASSQTKAPPGTGKGVLTTSAAGKQAAA